MKYPSLRLKVIAGLMWTLSCAATLAAGSLSEAVVRIHCHQAAGSGTLIHAHQGTGYILTAAHVVESGGETQAQWHNGYTAIATLAAADAQLDVALLRVTPPADATTIELAESDHWPQRGETVELIGYGGGRLRHWQASVNGYAMTDGIGRHQTLSLHTQTIGGDSGGAIVWRGKLVGVIWGGPLAGPRGPMLATHGTSCVAIGPFLTKHNIDLTAPALAQIIRPVAPDCPDGSCPLPVRISPPRQPRVPDQRPPTADQQQLLDAVARLEKRLAELEQHPNLNVNINDVSQRLIDLMAADPRFRGPPGQNGRDGADGSTAPVDVDQLTNRIRQRLAGSIRVRVEPIRDKVTR